MKWRTKTSKRFDKFLAKHHDVASQILKILRILSNDPYNNSLDITKLVNKSGGTCYRVRFGKYRLVYMLDNNNKIINFTAADARGGIYKNKK